jgi:hypothetical protein
MSQTRIEIITKHGKTATESETGDDLLLAGIVF